MSQLQTGDIAPDFSALTDKGDTLALSDLAGKRVVLYFYPKDDTPGCTAQACGFRDNYLAIEERDAMVLGVSPDGVKSHQRFRTKFNLPFTLIADEDHAIAEAYGVSYPTVRARLDRLIAKVEAASDPRITDPFARKLKLLVADGALPAPLARELLEAHRAALKGGK